MRLVRERGELGAVPDGGNRTARAVRLPLFATRRRRRFPHPRVASRPHQWDWYNVSYGIAARFRAATGSSLLPLVRASATHQAAARDPARSRREPLHAHRASSSASTACSVCSAICKFLTDHGLIEQPKAQWVWRRVEGGGSRPRIHSLANPGAALLRKLKLSSRKRDWAELNRNLSDAWFVLNVPHELGVVDAHVSFLRGVAARPDHSLETAATTAISIPGRERSIFPDKILIARGRAACPSCCPSRSTDRPNRTCGARSPTFRTWPRSSRPITSMPTPGCPSSNSARPRFRVLTAVEGGEAKMRNVARTAFEISGGTAPDRFLVTSLASLREGDPFEIEWMNAAGADGSLGGVAGRSPLMIRCTFAVGLSGCSSASFRSRASRLPASAFPSGPMASARACEAACRSAPSIVR